MASCFDYGMQSLTMASVNELRQKHDVFDYNRVYLNAHSRSVRNSGMTAFLM